MSKVATVCSMGSFMNTPTLVFTSIPRHGEQTVYIDYTSQHKHKE